MRKSIGARFLIVGLLTLLMFIPLFFVSDIVQSRKNYSQYTLNEVGREWGGEQVIAGPMLMIPVEETVERTEREAVVDPESGEIVLDADGSPRQRQVTRKVTVTRDPIYVYPGRFDVAIDTQTQIRHRGI
ncbi:MAG: inner membrane CreD family protein, partial [Rhodobacteraceae bacterium]|nr:inner membrane CreD family protein [Paracoccaceae bacterium]